MLGGRRGAAQLADVRAVSGVSAVGSRGVTLAPLGGALVTTTLALTVALTALAGCKGGAERSSDSKGSASAAGSGDGPSRAATATAAAEPSRWAASCDAALRKLPALEPQQRVAAIVAGCPVCEMAPILVERRDLKRSATYLQELDAAVQSCGGFCQKLARTDFLRLVQHQSDARAVSAKPWRQLAEQCQLELGWRPESRGFLGATWFLLERIAAAAGPRLGEAFGLAEGAPFPLPAVAAEGRGLGLPDAPAAARLVQPGRLVVSALAEGAMVGRLPWAKLTSGGVQVDGDYPGPRAAELGAALRAAEAALAVAPIAPEPPSAKSAAAASSAAPATAPVTLIAPLGLPALRLAEVVRQLGRPARLAVLPASSLPEYQPPMALPALLIASPAAGATRLALADSAALSAWSSAALAGKAAPIALAVGAEATVEELAAALAALHAAPSIALVAD